MGVSLAEGRVACSVAGAVAGRGGACQSRIHSGGAIDLDSVSPGGAEEGVGGCSRKSLPVNAQTCLVTKWDNAQAVQQG